MVKSDILNILSRNLLGAQELHSILKEKGIKADLVTVYRNLESLENAGLVKRTEFEDHITRFETSETHHHHLICTKCGVIEDVILNENLIKQIEKKSNFKVERHALEFFGLCRRCQ